VAKKSLTCSDPLHYSTLEGRGQRVSSVFCLYYTFDLKMSRNEERKRRNKKMEVFMGMFRADLSAHNL
jgi:hypothetical protein